MRLFAAIEISDEVREQLENFKKEGARLSQGAEISKKVKWVHFKNFHLTLKFFGEVMEERLEVLQTVLAESIVNQKKFVVGVRGVGCFPDFLRPRVLWAGIQQGSEELQRLAGAIEKSSISAGFGYQETFFAHLTIARFTALPTSIFLEGLKKQHSFSFGKINVEKVNLIQSTLRPTGADYRVLKSFSFL